MTTEFDAKTNGDHETFMVDFTALHENGGDAHGQSPPLTSIDLNNDQALYQNYSESWPSSDESSAPAPPDVSRGSIHEPSKTR